MPSNSTQNYNLNQWAAGDRVLRTDFNADNAKIDAAIKAVDQRVDGLSTSKADISALVEFGNCRVEYGTYVGTGIFGDTVEKAVVLRLGYQPKLVFISGIDCTGLFLFPNTTSLNVRLGDGISLQSEWLNDGLRWWAPSSSGKSAYAQFNVEGNIYHYVAFH